MWSLIHFPKFQRFVWLFVSLVESLRGPLNWNKRTKNPQFATSTWLSYDRSQLTLLVTLNLTSQHVQECLQSNQIRMWRLWWVNAKLSPKLIPRWNRQLVTFTITLPILLHVVLQYVLTLSNVQIPSWHPSEFILFNSLCLHNLVQRNAHFVWFGYWSNFDPWWEGNFVADPTTLKSQFTW